MRNQRGMTLIECLIVLVILGIIVQMLGSAMFALNRSLARVKAAQQVQATTNKLAFGWTDKALDMAKTPVLCFTGNSAYSCLPKGCRFDAGLWSASGHKCSGGILYY